MFIHRRVLQPEEIIGHFQLAVDNDGNAWILDTNTGEMIHCLKGKPGIETPTCYTAIQKSLPYTDANGWILNVDKNGNKAYVSPDRKQFEEVKQLGSE